MSSFEQQYYEAASFWEGASLLDSGNVRRFAETVKLIPSDTKTLLDAGCGNGIFGKILARDLPDLDVLGVDRSLTALQFAGDKTVQGGVDSLPVGDASYDCVSCLQVIEHLPVDVFEKTISELARVAGKYIIVGVPFDEATEKNVTQCPQCRTIFNCDLHLRRFSADTMVKLFSEVGFKHVSSVFPGGQNILIGSEVFNLLLVKFRAEKTPKFLSPICPICGYSEGDVTALSVAKSAPLCGPSPLRALLRNVRLALVKGITPFWPTKKVSGYWVVSLYARA